MHECGPVGRDKRPLELQKSQVGGLGGAWALGQSAEAAGYHWSPNSRTAEPLMLALTLRHSVARNAI
jgi:hypothetical protein